LHSPKVVRCIPTEREPSGGITNVEQCPESGNNSNRGESTNREVTIQGVHHEVLGQAVVVGDEGPPDTVLPPTSPPTRPAAYERCITR